MSSKWEWEEFPRVWIPFFSALSDKLEEEFTQTTRRFLTLDLAGLASHRIDFLEMTQKNTTTGYERKVRRTVTTTAPVHDQQRWMVHGDHGLIQYDDASHATICAAEDAGRPQLTLHINYYSYLISILERKQKNTHTQVVRDMVKDRIGPNGGAAGGAPAPAPQIPLTNANMQAPLVAPTAAAPQPHRGPNGLPSRQRENLLRSLVLSVANADDSCAVCLDGFSFEEDTEDNGASGLSSADGATDSSEEDNRPYRLPPCDLGHYFHAGCVKEFCLTVSKCPVCQTSFKKHTGNQPRNGHMDVMHIPRSQQFLPGYTDFGVIQITYEFPDGVQGADHPHPGVRYRGTFRYAYLPDNTEGREIMQMLSVAFSRRLTFTIGRSLTTGIDNCVVWNGIHHKTSTHGGPTAFGYPDPGYFARVTEELRLRGITADDIGSSESDDGSQEESESGVEDSYDESGSSDGDY